MVEQSFRIRILHILVYAIVLSAAFATLDLISRANENAHEVIAKSGFAVGTERIASIGNWPRKLGAFKFAVWGLCISLVYAAPVYLLGFSSRRISTQRFLIFAGPFVSFVIGNLPIIACCFLTDPRAIYELSQVTPLLIIVPFAVFTIFVLANDIKNKNLTEREIEFVVIYQIVCWSAVIIFLYCSHFRSVELLGAGRN